MLLTENEAMRLALEDIADRCRRHNITPLTGHDIPILTAATVFGRQYDRGVDKTLALIEAHPEREAELVAQFAAEAVFCAKRAIGRAILAPKSTAREVASCL